MQTNFIQAPWIIVEPDPTNNGFIVLQNNLTRKRFRFQENFVGNPIGTKAQKSWMSFLKAEKLIIEPEKILSELEDDHFYYKNGFEKNEQIVTFIPTHACHFACPYCYNQNIRDPRSETRIPAPEMAAKIGEHFSKSPAQKWSLNIIGGGEPLLVSQYIADIATLIRQTARENGRDFELDLVSNGHLLHGENLSMLIKAGLRKVRVTLDPDHDKSRPLANGQPTFDKIVSNLLNLPPSVELQLGSNVPIDKVEEFGQLLDKLEKLQPVVTDFSVSLIIDPLKNKVQTSGNGASRHYGPEEVDCLEKLIRLLDSAGFNRKVTIPRIECEAGRLCEKLVINMRGETTCCAGLDGMENYQTELSNGVVLGSMDSKLEKDESWKDNCFNNGSSCPFLPICHTGCRLISISKGSDWWTPNCEKLYFDQITRYELRKWAESCN